MKKLGWVSLALASSFLCAQESRAQETGEATGEVNTTTTATVTAPGERAETPPAETKPAEAASSEEVLVTAVRKRRESIFDTPAALSIIDSSSIKSLNIERVDDVAKYVPNLNITRFGVGNTSQAAIFIRGIGLQDHLITTDPGVGVYLDGVYLGRQMGNNMTLMNIERIEVLRGPQGTLYGRNTLGGAVNIVTRRPGEEDIFQLELQGGSRERAAASFYGNFKVPVADLAVSATGGFTHRAGVGKAINLVNPEKEIGEINEFSGRAAAFWKPTDTFRVLVSVDGLDAEDGQSPSTIEIIGAPAEGLGLPQLQQSDIPRRDDTATLVDGLESTSNRAIGTSATIEWDLAPDWTAKVLGSYRRSEYTGGLDDDITAYHLSEFPETGEASQYSGEIQLNGKVGPLDGVGGFYYFREKGSNFSGPFTFRPFNNANIAAGDFFELAQTTKAYAFYANVSYHLIEDLTLGGGIRYSKDQKDGSALFPSFRGKRQFRHGDFDAVTWDLNVSYRLRKNLSVYAQAQRGYQTGGFPPRPFGGPDQFNVFDKITALNYEAGFKGVVSDFATLYLAGFFTQYDDLALPFSMPQPTGFVTIVENAASSRAMGVEVEANFVFGNFFLNPSVGFIDHKITEVLEGTIGIQKEASPALTPKWTVGANVGAFYDFADGSEIRGQVDYSFRDKQFGQSVESASELLKARSLVGFNLRYASPARDWEFTVYGENIFDKVYDQGRLNNAFHGFVGIVLSNDRSEFGVKLLKRFGGI